MEFSTLNGYKVKDKKAIRYYDTVADMKADTTLKNGMHVKTKGYYSVSDGGSAEYIIVNDNELVGDNGSVHVLENDLKAKLLINNNINIKVFGAKGNNVTDDTNVIQNAIDYCSSNGIELFIPEGNYLISSVTFKGNDIKGTNNTKIKANTVVEDWIIIQEKTKINNIIFDGNELAKKITVTSSSGTGQGTIIESCIFTKMTGCGLYSNGIDVIIKNCIFRLNTQHGIYIQQVGNIVNSCYSYLNGMSGIFTTVGTLMISNCKSYKNDQWGYEVGNATSASYITISDCESQENGFGGVRLSPLSKNCIVSNFNSLGDNDVTTSGDESNNKPIIDVNGKYHQISGIVIPFHIYENNNWYSYPSCIVHSNGVNCKIDIKAEVNYEMYNTLKSRYPNLSYQTCLYTSYNLGQSNDIKINGQDVRSKITPSFEIPELYSSRGYILGNDNNNFIVSINPDFENPLATETAYTAMVTEKSLPDNFNVEGYQQGIAFPINNKNHFKSCISLEIVGTVGTSEVIKTTNTNPTSIISNTDINEYKLGTISQNDINAITQNANFVSGSLKLRYRLYVQKLDSITLTEPLLISCKNINYLHDNV